MAAAAWDLLSKAANLVVGLHAAMLVAVLTTLLGVQHRNKRACARLERCTRRLHALLQWPATGCCGVALLLCSEMADPFGKALDDAAALVESYKKSTLCCRIWNGCRMATQLRDMQDVVDSYCGLLLIVNAHLLLQQQAVHHHPIPPSSDTSTTAIPEVIDETSQSPSAQAVTSRPAVEGTQRASDIGQGGMDYDPATGSERNVPDDMLPIVISHAYS